MGTRRMINSKKIICRLLYLIIFPILLSLILFNPLVTYDFQCSDSKCQINQNGSHYVSDIDPSKIREHFMSNYVEILFKVGQKYDTYDVKIKDLSEVTPAEAINLTFKVNLKGQNYTIPCQEEIIIKNLIFQEDDKITPRGYIIERYPNTGNELLYGRVRVDYKVSICRPLEEYLIKTIILLIAWLAILRLLRKTHRYIFFDND